MRSSVGGCVWKSFEMARPRLPEAVADPEFVRVKAHTLEVFRREMNA